MPIRGAVPLGIKTDLFQIPAAPLAPVIAHLDLQKQVLDRLNQGHQHTERSRFSLHPDGWRVPGLPINNLPSGTETVATRSRINTSLIHNPGNI